MKLSILLASCIMAASTFAVGARQMHADINYERYLAEIDTTDEEMKSWKADFWTDNKWLPDFSEERSSDDIDEDLRQRIYMSKQDVLKAQAANPNANFSIMTPFSALTKEEFAFRVKNSYVRSNKTPSPTLTTAPPKRSLRQMETYTFTSTQDIINALMQSIQQQMGGSLTVGTVKPIINANANEVDTSSDAKQWHWTQPATVPPAPVTQAPIQVAPAPIIVAAGSKTPAPTPTPTPTPKLTTRPPVVEPLTKPPATPIPTEKGISKTANSVDWSASPCMSPVQSQGQCSSCWAFASVAAVESLQCIKDGRSEVNKYLEQQLVGCDSQNMGCSGGASAYAFEYIQQNGLCSEKENPYTLSDGGSVSCNTSCSKSQTGITGYEELDMGNEAGLIESLKLQPVVAAVASGNAAWKQYTGGVMSSCETSDVDHAVLIVGYDDTTFKVRNSWGESWGEAGYVRMQRTSSSSGTCGLLTDMSRPKM